MRIVEFNGQYRVTLPKTLVKDKRWTAGTELRFVEDMDGRVYLKALSGRQSARRR